MKNEEEKLKFEFSKEIITGNEKATVECFSINGKKAYKIIAKDGNFDGIDRTKDWEKKLKKEDFENER